MEEPIETTTHHDPGVRHFGERPPEHAAPSLVERVESLVAQQPDNPLALIVAELAAEVRDLRQWIDSEGNYRLEQSDHNE